MLLIYFLSIKHSPTMGYKGAYKSEFGQLQWFPKVTSLRWAKTIKTYTEASQTTCAE